MLHPVQEKGVEEIPLGKNGKCWYLFEFFQMDFTKIFAYLSFDLTSVPLLTSSSKHTVLTLTIILFFLYFSALKLLENTAHIEWFVFSILTYYQPS